MEMVFRETKAKHEKEKVLRRGALERSLIAGEDQDCAQDRDQAIAVFAME